MTATADTTPMDPQQIAAIAAATVKALQEAGHLPPPNGGLAPSPPPPAPAGPTRWRVEAGVDWSGGAGPTPRTDLAPFTLDNLVAAATVEVYAEPPAADAQPDPPGTPALYARYVGVVETQDRAAVERALAEAITAVAQQSTPATEGWGISYSVRPA